MIPWSQILLDVRVSTLMNLDNSIAMAKLMGQPYFLT